MVGPLLGLYFGTDVARPTTTGPSGPTKAVYAAFFHAMLDRGVALAPGAYEVLFPGLAHTKDELERVTDIASAAAREVAAKRSRKVVERGRELTRRPAAMPSCCSGPPGTSP